MNRVKCEACNGDGWLWELNAENINEPIDCEKCYGGYIYLEKEEVKQEEK